MTTAEAKPAIPPAQEQRQSREKIIVRLKRGLSRLKPVQHEKEPKSALVQRVEGFLKGVKINRPEHDHDFPAFVDYIDLLVIDTYTKLLLSGVQSEDHPSAPFLPTHKSGREKLLESLQEKREKEQRYINWKVRTYGGNGGGLNYYDSWQDINKICQPALDGLQNKSEQQQALAQWQIVEDLLGVKKRKLRGRSFNNGPNNLPDEEKERPVVTQLQNRPKVFHNIDQEVRRYKLNGRDFGTLAPEGYSFLAFYDYALNEYHNAVVKLIDYHLVPPIPIYPTGENALRDSYDALIEAKSRLNDHMKNSGTFHPYRVGRNWLDLRFGERLENYRQEIINPSLPSEHAQALAQYEIATQLVQIVNDRLYSAKPSFFAQQIQEIRYLFSGGDKNASPLRQFSARHEPPVRFPKKQKHVFVVGGDEENEDI